MTEYDACLQRFYFGLSSSSSLLLLFWCGFIFLRKKPGHVRCACKASLCIVKHQSNTCMQKKLSRVCMVTRTRLFLMFQGLKGLGGKLMINSHSIMNQALPQKFIDTPCINTLPTSGDCY